MSIIPLRATSQSTYKEIYEIVYPQSHYNDGRNQIRIVEKTQAHFLWLIRPTKLISYQLSMILYIYVYSNLVACVLM